MLARLEREGDAHALIPAGGTAHLTQPLPLSDVSSETQQGSINKSIVRQLIIFLQAARPAPGKLPSQQVLKLQQACYMALRVCVPVYDTVTQAFRVSCCNDSEARRTIWTRPAQMAGQAVQAV